MKIRALFFAIAFLVFLHPQIPAVAASSTDSTSDCLQEQGGSAASSTTLTISFLGPPAAGNTVVLMLAYGNKKNRNNFTVSGMGTTWTAGYAPNLKKGFGMAFFYGGSVDGIGDSVTVTAPQTDNLVATIQEWSNLSTEEDAKAHKTASRKSTTPKITVHTKNDSDVIFNTVVYGGAVPPQSSPPTGQFLFHGNSGNTFAPVMQGGYLKTLVKGKYTNSFKLQSPTVWVSFATAVKSTGTNQLFTDATPLTDFAPGQLYDGAYQGLLYDGSNQDSGQHDADGKAIANSIVPLDLNGNPSSTGKIVMVAMGPSNWTEEMCSATPITPSTGPDICDPNTFFDQAEKQMATLFPGDTLNPNLLLVNCAKGGAFINQWLDITSDEWVACENGGDIMNAYTTSQAQVQIVTLMDDVKGGIGTLDSLNGAGCPPNPSADHGDPNACVYELALGSWVRLVKQQFPNLKMIFLQTRPYAGYASKEPLPYETGYAIKWLIQAQIQQTNGAPPDPLNGDLSYSVNGSTALAPWLGWGAYAWGPGPIPRADGETWLGGNYSFDGVHPSKCNYASPWTYCGRGHDAHLMMQFYTTSAYTTPWFLARPN